MYRVLVDVRFADLDALGHVNSTRILEYAEHARVNWLLEHGAPSASRLPIILASAHAEYKAPIQKSAHVEVLLSVSKVGTKSWTFDYDVRDAESGTTYATVQTVQVAYDYDRAQTIPIPPALRANLESMAVTA
jgi:acyl-CoA thioester hydrolase